MTSNRRISKASQSFPKTLPALAYAERLHAGQRRHADGGPFIPHPFEVRFLLDHAGAPDDVIPAGVLHDTIARTDAHAADVRARFGLPIATLVLAVIEDPRIIGYAHHKAAALHEQAACAGHEPQLAQVRDHQRTLHPASVSRSRNRRLPHYRGCLRLLEEHLPARGTPARLAARHTPT